MGLAQQRYTFDIEQFLLQFGWFYFVIVFYSGYVFCNSNIMFSFANIIWAHEIIWMDVFVFVLHIKSYFHFSTYISVFVD